MRIGKKRYWLILLLTLGIGLGGPPLICAEVSPSPGPALKSPPLSEGKDQEKPSSGEGLAAIITAVGALVTALLSPFVVIWQAREKSRKDTQGEIEGLLKDFDKFENGMRMVLSKVPESDSLWKIVSNTLSFNREFADRLLSTLFSHKDLRERFLDMLLFEVISERRGQLQGIVLDQSSAAKLGNPNLTEQEIGKALKSLQGLLHGFQDSRRAPDSEQGAEKE